MESELRLTLQSTDLTFGPLLPDNTSISRVLTRVIPRMALNTLWP